MRNDPTTPVPRSDLTTVAAEHLGNLRNELSARHHMPGGPINANAGTAILRLPGLSVFCHGNQRFTWDNGRDEHEQVKLGKAPIDPLHVAADLIAARYREVHGYQPAPARRAG